MDNELVENRSGYLLAKDFSENDELLEELNGLSNPFGEVRIPTGRGLSFEIAEDDEEEMVKEIEGVILYHHPANAYYKEKYSGGSNPPDCGSYDGIIGEGIPGGEYSKCEYNKFGSDGNGKACKNKRRLFILREGEVFPTILLVPIGSIKGCECQIKVYNFHHLIFYT